MSCGSVSKSDSGGGRAPWVRVIEKRDDFRAYFDRLKAEPNFLAREIKKQQIAANIEAQREALKEAIRAGDNLEVERLTRWAVKLAFRPKRARRKAVPPIVITLGEPPRPAIEMDPEASGSGAGGYRVP